MTYIKYFLASSILNLVLVSCSTSKDILPDTSPKELYSIAHKKIESGNFQSAIIQLEKLNNRYPFGPYSKRAQLDLIHAYYESDNLELALVYIDRFMRFNPTHPNIDYVIYIRALSDMALDENLLHKLFMIDRSDRDPQYARAAFRDFSLLIERFPNSRYISDAKKHLILLTDRLAKHELSVVEYYTKRGAYVAVINRVVQMLREYPNTKATKDALSLMQYAFNRLQLNNEAEKVAKIIHKNSR